MSEGMRKPLQARRGSLMRTASIVVFGSGGSTRSSVVTMVQSTLGAGVLTLPFALSQAGIVIGLELLLAACTLNFMAGWAIARASQETRMSSFSGLSALISKNHAVIIFLDIATIVLVLGIVSSCLFVFGDSLEDMLQGVDVGDSVALRYLTNRNVMIGAVTFVAVLPVASIKKVDSLRFVSTLALLLQLLVCAYVMFIGATNLAASGTVALTVRLNREPSMDTIHAFSCFIFAFCNQIQLPYVVEKMQNSERDLMPTLMWSSVLLFVFNCLFSLAGWLAVGSGEVNGDILRNLPVGTVVGNLARGLQMVCQMSAFPLLMLPVRSIIAKLLDECKKSKGDSSANTSLDTSPGSTGDDKTRLLERGSSSDGLLLDRQQLDEATCNDVLNDARNSKGYVGFKIGPPSSQRLLRDVAAEHGDEDLEIAIGVSIDAPLHSIDSLDPDPSCSDNSFDEEVQSASRKPSGVRQEGCCGTCGDVALTAIVLLVAFGVAVISNLVGDLSLIIGLTSSVAGVLLALITPLLVWLAVFKNAPAWPRCSMMGFTWFAIFCSVVCTGAIVYSAATQ